MSRHSIGWISTWGEMALSYTTKGRLLEDISPRTNGVQPFNGFRFLKLVGGVLLLQG